MRELSFYAVCPLGLEKLLEDELAAAGAGGVRAARGSAFFSGTMEAAMRACLQSRTASRIMLRVGSSEYRDSEDVYFFACRTKWEEYFGPEQSIRVDINARRSPLTSLAFATLRIKDGICDRFAHFQGERPPVDRAHPKVRVFAFLEEEKCTFYLDLCGEGLFKRGWRREKGEAPLKENLAAGLLMLSGWTPEKTLLDPFCGSGTIAIEAASIATGTAPGLKRRFLFENLKNFDRSLWQDIRDDALSRVNLYTELRIAASDISTIVAGKARENAARAGFSALMEAGKLTFDACDARVVMPPAEVGVIIANPPYGEQSNPKSASAASMMKDVSDNLKRNFSGWSAWFLTSDLDLPREMRLSESRRIALFNGPLECRFFRFDMMSGRFDRHRAGEGGRESSGLAGAQDG